MQPAFPINYVDCPAAFQFPYRSDLGNIVLEGFYRGSRPIHCLGHWAPNRHYLRAGTPMPFILARTAKITLKEIVFLCRVLSLPAKNLISCTVRREHVGDIVLASIINSWLQLTRQEWLRPLIKSGSDLCWRGGKLQMDHDAKKFALMLWVLAVISTVLGLIAFLLISDAQRCRKVWMWRLRLDGGQAHRTRIHRESIVSMRLVRRRVNRLRCLLLVRIAATLDKKSLAAEPFWRG